MTQPQPKKSDLPVRAVSAVVMVAVAGWVWTGFVAAVALGVLWEWVRLSRAFAQSALARGAWVAGGLGYVGLAASVLVRLRNIHELPVLGVVLVAGVVIATDVGAYFSGRTFGGPKIAPRISPSKTWSGLIGGILAAGLVIYFLLGGFRLGGIGPVLEAICFGALGAITAQTGDFFESWMKRRAGVKDSGNLIPGHGGLFDRVDGLLAVCFVLGLLSLPSLLSGQ
ncbi:MAG: phosphatidate cytidylyltransferase [Sphingomonadales bacterium]|nr:phosphatidate cytidylyltransferase [Sphingomonadales bacterium]